MSMGPWQIVLIVAIVLIFFGPKRIPGLGKSIGEAIRGFKKGISEVEGDEDSEIESPEQLERTSSSTIIVKKKEKETQDS